MELFSLDDDFKRYQRLRQVGFAINATLTKQIPKPAVLKYAKKLGMINRKTIVFQNETELDILTDYILYNHRPKGKNLVERYLESIDLPPFSDEMTVLQGMVNSRYSVFFAERVLKGKGLELTDVLKRDTLALMDKNLGMSHVEGAIFAGRVIPLRNFYMTSGAFLPVDSDIFEHHIVPDLIAIAGKADNQVEVSLTKGQVASFSAKIIRLILKSDLMERTVFQ